jgi:hypothetical protein
LLASEPEEIFQTWHALGEVTVTKKTKMYPKDSIIRVDASSGNGKSKAPLHNCFLYVAETYVVDRKTRFEIDWETVSIDDVSGLLVASEGIQVPYWVVLPAKWSTQFTPDDNFIPYASDNGMIDNGGIIIKDEDLELLLVEVGFPFLSFNDVEYSKAEITRVCVKPAMQRFYTFFPIIQEEAGGNYGRGNEFLVPFPENAYACVPYYTVPGGTSASQASNNPFSFYNELQLTGAFGASGGGAYGRGIHYNGKRTPGFVGMDWKNTQLDRLAVSQAMLNYFRREKYRRVKIDDKLYAKGFTTIGGNLNFKWLCWSPDFDNVPFELLEPVARPMCKIAILRAFGVLRSLVKTDIAGQLDATVLTNAAKELEDAIKPILNSIATSGVMALSRGSG